MNHLTLPYDFTRPKIGNAVFMLLFIILVVGCAPAAVETDRQTLPDNSQTGAEQALATPTGSPLASADIPGAELAPTSGSAIGSTPTEISHPTNTPAPAEMPTTAPTTTPDTVASPLAGDTPVAEPAAGMTDTVELENNEALAHEGLRVYKEQYCGICHKLDIANTGGLFGPDQNQIGTTAAQRVQDPGYSGLATTAAGYIRESILDPQIYLVKGYEQSRHHMPAFTHLSEAEVNALVALLLQQQ